MAKRRKSSFFRLETIVITVLVLAFFIWALGKFDMFSKISDWFTPDVTEEEVMAAELDSLQNRLDELRPIYITIDNLKMRTEPTLKSSVIKKLPLYERVYFTGALTDTTTRINIGRIHTDEPWVQVLDEEGTEGWLYGAGVHFYKTENPNALSN